MVVSSLLAMFLCFSMHSIAQEEEQQVPIIDAVLDFVATPAVAVLATVALLTVVAPMAFALAALAATFT